MTENLVLVIYPKILRINYGFIKLFSTTTAIGSFTTASIISANRVGTPDVGAIEYGESSAGGLRPSRPQPILYHPLRQWLE
jgi:hypothetical protein